MKLCSFWSGSRVVLGVLEGEMLYNLSSSDPETFATWATAYNDAGSPARLVSVVGDSMKKAEKLRFSYGILRIPVVPGEIWAAGVTYMRSREARETETKLKGLYDYVYDAERPELFVKDTGLRCVGPGDAIRVRGDSRWSVPEPELSVVLDSSFRTVGYTVGNDVSSRDIEGENPLYLPQAKVYQGSSAIGPVITTADEIPDPRSLKIVMRILRAGKLTFEGSVSTSQMKRRVEDLVAYLRRDNVIRPFTVLMTGTSIIPPDDFTLRGGDVVEIEIEKIGILRNTVDKLGQYPT